MDTRYYISKKANELISNMIFISGCGQRGTIILGKLIHYVKKVSDQSVQYKEKNR